MVSVGSSCNWPNWPLPKRNPTILQQYASEKGKSFVGWITRIWTWSKVFTSFPHSVVIPPSESFDSPRQPPSSSTLTPTRNTQPQPQQILPNWTCRGGCPRTVLQCVIPVDRHPRHAHTCGHDTVPLWEPLVFPRNTSTSPQCEPVYDNRISAEIPSMVRRE